MTYRIKLVLRGDAHYWHAPTLEEAERIRKDLLEDLIEVVGVAVWIYADTRHGHVRVS